ncbi:condensation domain-containing protein [Streptomyces cinerochromogenes]|uniref:Condensation domain-containing protein n=1 Tax=Streptomyces cinerochromogenes TaxID=66422 RepID=A0ABW7B607_9ACTN
MRSTSHLYHLTAAQSAHLRNFPPDPGGRTAIWREQKITGVLDTGRLLRAVEAVVARHQSLRLALHQEGSLWRQRLRRVPPITLLITAKNIKSTAPDQFFCFVDKFLSAEMSKQWDLTEGFPFRFFLLRYSSTLHVWIMGFSHLFIDANSADVIQRELWNFYRGGEGYADLKSDDYAARFLVPAKHGKLGTSDDGSAERLWAGQFSGIPSFARAWKDENWRRSKGETKPYYITSRISGDSLSRLRRNARHAQVSEFQWTLSSLANSIFQISSVNRITVAITTDLRRPENRDAVGMFTIRVPVVLERQASPGIMPMHVKQQVIRSLIAYRRMDPDVLDRAIRGIRGSAGGGGIDDLTFNHRTLPILPSSRRSSPYVSRYNSLVREPSYLPDGLDVRLTSGPEHIDCQFIANGYVLSTELQERLHSTFVSSCLSGSSNL